jgi:hypothetical protein
MTAALAFRYRPRRGGQDMNALVGDVVPLEEQTEYILSFERPLTSIEERRLAEIGAEKISPEIVALSFANFVGRVDLAGVRLNVRSAKIGDDGVSRVLDEIAEISARLVFGTRSPVLFGAEADGSPAAPVPYHQLQLLRRVMLREPAGERLQDWFEAIERGPTRRFAPERPVVAIDRVRRLDSRSVQSIFSRLDRLVPIDDHSPLAGSPLAARLRFGVPPQAHFPEKVASPRGRLSFDTAENRFVKHVLGECLAIVYRFVNHPALHAEMARDCSAMLAILEQSASAPFLAEAGRLSGFQSPSQALSKAEGYRQMFGFWQELGRAMSLPRTASETMRLLEGRDMATLYEYWVFVKVLEAVASATGALPDGPPKIRRDELGESLSRELTSTFGSKILVKFNPTFARSKQRTAYSTPLRPDVVVEHDGERHAFDAKYRLDRLDSREDDADDDQATYKRADLYKMHTYRDAISGLSTAFAVYPGTEFVFFERPGFKRTACGDIGVPDGVGAIPLRPTDPTSADDLRDLLSRLLKPHPST